MNLILGAISDYPWYVIEPFFTSYKKCFSDCECVMFINNLSDCAIKILNEIGIKCVQIPNEYVKDSMNCRWVLYRDYLREHGSEYDQVLLTDVRDVVFVRDLFKTCDSKGKYLGIALERETLAEDLQWNGAWMKRKFGEAEFELHKHRQCICCGTIWGDPLNLEHLMTKMVELVYSDKYEIFYPGNDQTVMQYLIYNNLLDEKICIKESDPLDFDCNVLTLAAFTTDETTAILDNKYQHVSVVHQYDRYPLLNAYIDNNYRDDIWAIDYITNNDIKNEFDSMYLSLKEGNYEQSLTHVTNMCRVLPKNKPCEQLQWKDIMFLMAVIKRIDKGLCEKFFLFDLLYMSLLYFLRRVKIGYFTEDDIRNGVFAAVDRLNTFDAGISEKLTDVSMRYKSNRKGIFKALQEVSNKLYETKNIIAR